MKQVINEKLIKRNKKIGNITSIIGITILGAGLVLNINPTPTRTFISFGALVIGFIIAQISTYYVTKFSRSPRYDEIITDNLSKLNNKYTLFVYNSPVPILLTGPTGLWIPIAISASGEIYYDKKWKQSGGNFLLKIFGQENLGRPELEVKTSEKQIWEILSDHFTEDQMPSINSILVSMHPRAILGDVEEAPIPIVEADALRRTIRRFDRKTEEEIPPKDLEEDQ